MAADGTPGLEGITRLETGVAGQVAPSVPAFADKDAALRKAFAAIDAGYARCVPARPFRAPRDDDGMSGWIGDAARAGAWKDEDR